MFMIAPDGLGQGIEIKDISAGIAKKPVQSVTSPSRRADAGLWLESHRPTGE